MRMKKEETFLVTVEYNLLLLAFLEGNTEYWKIKYIILSVESFPKKCKQYAPKSCVIEVKVVRKCFYYNTHGKTIYETKSHQKNVDSFTSEIQNSISRRKIFFSFFRCYAFPYLFQLNPFWIEVDTVGSNLSIFFFILLKKANRRKSDRPELHVNEIVNYF